MSIQVYHAIIIAWGIGSAILCTAALLLMLYVSFVPGLLIFLIAALIWPLLFYFFRQQEKNIEKKLTDELGSPLTDIAGLCKVNGKSWPQAKIQLCCHGFLIEGEKERFGFPFSDIEDAKQISGGLQFQVKDLGEVRIMIAKAITEAAVMKQLDKSKVVIKKRNAPRNHARGVLAVESK